MSIWWLLVSWSKLNMGSVFIPGIFDVLAKTWLYIYCMFIFLYLSFIYLFFFLAGGYLPSWILEDTEKQTDSVSACFVYF